MITFHKAIAFGNKLWNEKIAVIGWRFVVKLDRDMIWKSRVGNALLLTIFFFSTFSTLFQTPDVGPVAKIFYLLCPLCSYDPAWTVRYRITTTDERDTKHSQASRQLTDLNIRAGFGRDGHHCPSWSRVWRLGFDIIIAKKEAGIIGRSFSLPNPQLYQWERSSPCPKHCPHKR